jgi:predicted permease
VKRENTFCRPTALGSRVTLTVATIVRLLQSTANALRVALRSVGRNRALVAIAALSLGLASAVTTTMFAVVDTLAHPAALIPQAGSVYEIRVSKHESRATSVDGDFGRRRAYAELASTAGLDQEIAAEQWLKTAILKTPVDQQAVAAARVTPNYLRLLGVTPTRGRLFRPEDVRSNGAHLAVITEGVWNLLFASSADVATPHVTINDTSYTVVGVLPTSWRQLGFPSVILSADSGAIGRASNEFIRIIARVDRESSVGSLLAKLNVILARLESSGEKLKSSRVPRIEVVPLSATVSGVAGLHWLLWIAALLVLAIACANVGTLLLVRGTRRRSELALRAALGGRRIDLVGIVLAETTLLAAAGASVGLLLSVWLIHLATDVIPGAFRPVLGTPHISFRVFASCIATAFVTVLISGVFPALRASGVDAIEALKDGSAATSGRVGKNLRLFVAGELLLSFMLLVGVGLLARSILRSATIDYGVDFRGLYRTTLNQWDASRVFLTANYARPDSVRQSAAETDQRANLKMRAAVARVGVVGSVGTVLPEISVPQQALRVDTNSRLAQLDRYAIVSSGFFRTLGLRDSYSRPVVLDSMGARRFAVVDEILARRLWGSADARGHMLRLGGNRSDEPTLPVVAVIRPFLLDVAAGADARHAGQLFVIDDTIAPQGTSLLIRATANDRTNRQQILTALRSIDPSTTFSRVALVQSEHELLLDRQRFVEKLAGAIALFGVSLALIGLYAVVSFTVALRSREFAVRTALGAPPASVSLLVLREGLALVAFGGFAGVLMTLALRRVIAAAFFGQEAAAIDAPTIVATFATLLIVCLAACLRPARSAARAQLATLLRAN